MRQLFGCLVLVVVCLCVQLIKAVENENNCESDIDCEKDKAGVCQNGACEWCLNCEHEFNRKAGNKNNSCPPPLTLDCGECLPNYNSSSDSSVQTDIQDPSPAVKCELLTEISWENAADVSIQGKERDKNTPWLYIGIVGAFILAFSGIGTYLGWKYRSQILEMKRRRKMITNKLRQRKEDFKKTPIREKQRLRKK
ncbi:hypothetical protein CHUAL_001589 [Chamberlinius hualienensis]